MYFYYQIYFLSFITQHRDNDFQSAWSVSIQMKKDLMDILVCPTCKSDLTLEIELIEYDEIIKGSIRCESCATIYKIEDSIPDFMPSEIE